MKLLQGLIRLKSGIETNDRSAIEEAFVLITGEVAQFPAGCSGSCGSYTGKDGEQEGPEFLSLSSELYSISGNIFSCIPIEDVPTPPEDISAPIRDFDLDFTMNKSAAKVPSNDESSLEQKKSSAFENKFSPGLEIDDEEGYDKINDAVKPVARTRRAHKQSEVFCQDCKKTISVDPMFKKEPYYCDLIKLGQKCPNAK
jgi:hypothetical protein